MKRTSPAASRIQPTPRAARRSEWLRGALAHHHCPEGGVENEIVVLATGIDQYLQEVFHHLAHTSRNDTVSAEDFSALCAVLGLRRPVKPTEGSGHAEEGEADSEFGDVCSGLPRHLSFKDFHSRLCAYFRARSARRGAGQCPWRLPVSQDTELVEKQIRLRWPRVRRRKCVRFDLDRSLAVTRSADAGTKDAPQAASTDEVWALRELVEDLRSVLQGSDARCLALEVALCRERSRTPSSNSSLTSSEPSPATSITFREGKLVPTQRIKGRSSGERRAAGSRDVTEPLLRELKLIRSSCDGQLEEAMKLNERLEEELRWAYQEVGKLQGVEAALRKENAEIRRRAEEAREALSMGLQKVRQIQQQAQSVPLLQSRIKQLEAQMQQDRSCSACVSDSTQSGGAEDTCSNTAAAECLQRAVEGRAASDEEEDVSRQPGCGRGCQTHAVPRPTGDNFIRTSRASRGRCCCCRSLDREQDRSRGCEKAMRREEEEEKEKARLSLLEEKLTDALTLLLQLRNKNVSRRTLGNIVMDTLDVCSGDGPSPSSSASSPDSVQLLRCSRLGPSQVLQVADALCLRLSSSDLLRGCGTDEGGAGGSRDELLLAPSGHQPCAQLLINKL